MDATIRMASEQAAYRVLRLFSHTRNRLTEQDIAAEAAHRRYEPEMPEWFMRFVSPHIDLQNTAVLDVGCGFGDLCIWLVSHGAARATGIDVDPLRIDNARRIVAAQGYPSQIHLECADFVETYAPAGQFDLLFSLDAFEHVLNPLACLRKAYACLRPGGALVTLFGPLWFSPYGAHMWGFTKLPWVQFIFPERVVLRVRAECFRPGQPVKRYDEIVGHLSRMTVAEFQRCALAAGFRFRTLRLNPDKDVNRRGLFRPLNSVINATPILRELGAQSLFAILDRP